MNNETRVPVADALDSFIGAIGRVVGWANIILVGVIILQVVLRYGFGSGLIVLEELQWHLYAVAVMFGISYALTTDSHIRVDIIHMRMAPRTKAFWELFGILVFLLPFIIVVTLHSFDFFWDSWRIDERSDAPLGLPWRWAIKGVIPISFLLLGLATLSRLIRTIKSLKGV
ncbi:MAG: TRAP transporter small permease subunit [Gammaproteobacteria bacterium]|nr:TRAP transporter small permease subunit [Gammaproteobacteria bacterium]